ncbi:sigma-70 family RNA polymerase sigma factor, partial [bacterium]|nr:sigma-70 family RNA polymerase sigma factor [bacterium]
MTTSWTVVEGAHGHGSEAYGALVKLCESYRYPIYAFIRKRCHDSEEAKDLCQAFFAELILEKRIFENAKRGDGRFRTYLLACVKNFLTGDYHRRHAQKRGGGVEHLSFDGLDELYEE